jgi:hypothetical protein
MFRAVAARRRWWFENFAATTLWNGVDFSGPAVSHYHLWHHRHHIAVMPQRDGANSGGNGFAVGDTTVIREQFNDFRDFINGTVTTARLDDTEFTFVIKRFGLTVGRIVHLYHQTDAGLRFYAETEIGVKAPLLGALLNWLVLPFNYSKATARHWLIDAPLLRVVNSSDKATYETIVTSPMSTVGISTAGYLRAGFFLDLRRRGFGPEDAQQQLGTAIDSGRHGELFY